MITLSTILQEEDYDPKPGLEYEIAQGVVVKMKMPVEQVIEDWQKLRDEARQLRNAQQETAEKQSSRGFTAEEEASFRRLIIKQALTVVEGVNLENLNGQVVFPVADRVSEDFFFLSTPKPGRQMRSLMANILSDQAQQASRQEDS